MRRQSEHFADYREAVEKLSAQGLVYPSFESRAEIASLVAQRETAGAMAARSRRRAALSGDREVAVAGRARAADRIGRALCAAARHGGGARAGRRISPGSSRAKGPTARPARSRARPQAWGDVILARKETPTSYHLSVVIDDALQGVTDVVRGQDLFWSTSVHRLLQGLLGLPQPAYRHHRLVLRCRRAQAVEIDRGHRLARACAPRAPRRPISAAWSACHNLFGSYLASSPPKGLRDSRGPGMPL